MREKLTPSLLLAATIVLVTIGPAFAQDAGSKAKPWHYWIAPFLLGGGVVLLAAIGVGYYIRVMGGPRRGR